MLGRLLTPIFALSLLVSLTHGAKAQEFSDNQKRFLERTLGELPPPLAKSRIEKNCGQAPTFECALTWTFDGDQVAGNLARQFYSKTGYVVSVDQINSDQEELKWRPEQIEILIRVFAGVPKSFLKLKPFSAVRLIPEVSPTTYSGNSPVGFLELSTNFDKLGIGADSLVMHELGHHVWIHFTYTDKKVTTDFMALSGWKRVEGYHWPHSPSAKFVSDTASHNAKEDFAECVSFYKYAPDELKRVSPEKYEFMRMRVFKP